MTVPTKYEIETELSTVGCKRNFHVLTLRVKKTISDGDEVIPSSIRQVTKYRHCLSHRI